MLDAKTCPFCGSDDQELALAEADGDGTPVALNCRACGAVGPMVYVETDSTPLSMLAAAQGEWDERAEMGKSGD
jgi:hypothetical protein